MAGPFNLLAISLAVLFGAYIGPILQPLVASKLHSNGITLPPSSLFPFPLPFPFSTPSSPQPLLTSPATCPPHRYATQIISLDPLLIHIADFVSPSEAAELIAVGTPLLAPSPVTGTGSGSDRSSARTSWSAPLPLSAGSGSGSTTVVGCVLDRAAAFLGTLLAPGRDDMGSAQLVRYTAGQKFDLHHDWFARPRLAEGDAEAGVRRLYNRAATVFVVLQANCTGGGGTWFPNARVAAPQDRRRVEKGEGEPVWREHEEGGLVFRPVPGNALFWVNLLPDGTGDARTLHAGLPIEGGVKHGMNIWPRVFFGPDA